MAALKRNEVGGRATVSDAENQNVPVSFSPFVVQFRSLFSQALFGIIDFMATRLLKKKSTSSKRRPPLARTVATKGKVTREFTRQITEFIERYRPALEALSRK